MNSEVGLHKNLRKGGNKEASAISLLLRLLKIGKKYVPWYIGLAAGALTVSAISLLDTEGLRRIINVATARDASLLWEGVKICLAALVVGQLIDFSEVMQVKCWILYPSAIFR